MATMKQKADRIENLIMAKVFATILVIIILVGMLAGCGVNPNSATKALEAQGMTDVQIEGYAWFGGCGKDDAFQSYFSATGANGQPITGSICQGFFKGTTVRFD